MMTSKQITDYLQSLFAEVTFYNGSIDKRSKECIGVYTKGNSNNFIALGGKQNTSYGILPITILIHWSEDTDACQIIANEIYEEIFGLSNITFLDENDTVIGHIISTKVFDPCPIDIGRDTNNICEMTFRFDIFYKREET